MGDLQHPRLTVLALGMQQELITSAPSALRKMTQRDYWQHHCNRAYWTRIRSDGNQAGKKKNSASVGGEEKPCAPASRAT
jgi:hypothetical protein